MTVISYDEKYAYNLIIKIYTVHTSDILDVSCTYGLIM
jgi:hypothetical protein